MDITLPRINPHSLLSFFSLILLYPVIPVKSLWGMGSTIRQVQATDAQIDRLVYELYDLTEEEIKIVEGG